METTLIIITLLLIGVFNLLTLGVLVALLLNTKLNHSPLIKSDSDISAPILSDDEKERARRQKKAYEDQLSAINEMLNYNADVAYGIKPKDEY